jgi:Protein of unknown function, DUF481.
MQSTRWLAVPLFILGSALQGLEIRDDLTYWPSFERWVNWQMHNELTLSSRILHRIYVSLALITDIDNEPSLGREKEDTKILLGVSHKF